MVPVNSRPRCWGALLYCCIVYCGVSETTDWRVCRPDIVSDSFIIILIQVCGNIDAYSVATLLLLFRCIDNYRPVVWSSKLLSIPRFERKIFNLLLAYCFLHFQFCMCAFIACCRRCPFFLRSYLEHWRLGTTFWSLAKFLTQLVTRKSRS
jgi:hypothetical protein